MGIQWLFVTTALQIRIGQYQKQHGEKCAGNTDGRHLDLVHVLPATHLQAIHCADCDFCFPTIVGRLRSHLLRHRFVHEDGQQFWRRRYQRIHRTDHDRRYSIGDRCSGRNVWQLLDFGPQNIHVVFAFRFSKSVGRRKLLFISGIGAAICIALAALCLVPEDQSTESRLTPMAIGQNRGNAMFVCFLGYVCFTSFGFMVIPWTLIGELFPIEVCAHPIWNWFRIQFQRLSLWKCRTRLSTSSVL